MTLAPGGGRRVWSVPFPGTPFCQRAVHRGCQATWNPGKCWCMYFTF